ncbi:hypothetical protein [Sphingobacterium sp. JB170]|uniref:hypothetical protein n=1 Tax=Sphingobacterium sp. JB170 TaxID=1434842 RepID=UPI00097ED682|nr:hypothetical protein [Sphingobacterium sp. JB170]SJN49779.1 hypothetical protein FM107_19215 [Sphingobacterium sp. JB170]
MKNNFRKDRFRTVSFTYTEDQAAHLKEDWQDYLSDIGKFPRDRYQGKGIVYTAGGVSYVTCLWVSISQLRNTGCTLPIEVWHVGNEVSNEIIAEFRNLDVTFRDFNRYTNVTQRGYILKPLAILNSSFKEVLFLDADNICVKDPNYLFESVEYRVHGALFWPDFWKTGKSNSIWKITGVKPKDLIEQESGQILIDVERCWKALNLCLYFNRLGEYYYRILLGDKDTFKFSWLASNTDYYMIDVLPGSCGRIVDGMFIGNTMVQFGTDHSIQFLHRNLLKWDVTYDDERVWEFVQRYLPNSTNKKISQKITKDGMYSIELLGDIAETDARNLEINIPALEDRCLNYLKYFRQLKSYSDYLLFDHFAKNRHR